LEEVHVAILSPFWYAKVSMLYTQELEMKLLSLEVKLIVVSADATTSFLSGMIVSTK
jgi:hypothetical protein